MISIEKTPQELRVELAERFKAQRLLQNLSREGLSEKAGVPTPTIRKFEDTGEISLKAFIALSFALDKTNEIESLMQISAPENLAQLHNRKRMRGRG